MAKARLASTILLVLAGFLVIQGTLMHVLSPGTRCDLDILLLAGQRFLEHSSIYRLDDLNEHTKPPLLSPLLALLSSMPREVIRTAWDAMNVILPIAALSLWWKNNSVERTLRHRQFWVATAASLIMLRGFWRNEMDLAQYNLFVLVLTLYAHCLASRGAILSSGAFFALGFLIKPTQLFFLPWLLSASPRLNARILLRYCLGAAALAGSLSLLYLFQYSADEMVRSHLDWLHFLPESTHKHILRTDNWGLPSILARMGWFGGTSPLFTLFGVAALAMTSRKWRTSPEGLFHLSAWTSLALSPMAWTQNFVVLFPLAFSLAYRVMNNDGRLAAGFGCIALFLPNAIRAQSLPEPLHAAWLAFSAPLLLALVAMIVAVKRLRIRKESSPA